MKPIDYIESKVHPKNFRILYDNGTISKNTYNKTRIVEIIKTYENDRTEV